jgi:bifunctional non-homologous end joining protein LigD
MIVPMKAVSAELPDDDQNWAFEIKWDGYRTLAHVDQGKTRLQSLRIADITPRWPALADLASAVNAQQAVLDGEVVAFDASGRPSFNALQRNDMPVTYLLFDVLEIDHHDTTGLPYEQRRALLEKLVEPGPSWKVVDSEVGGGRALLDVTEELGLEGIVAKRLGSTYQIGKRSPAWRKIKHRRRQELVIGGFTQGEGNRAGAFGSLMVGYYDDEGLHFAGGVGTGFDSRMLEQLRRRLDELTIPNCPFVEPPSEVARRIGWRPIARQATWVRPELVGEVAFSEWTPDGIVRQASFLGLRDDKLATDVVRETP